MHCSLARRRRATTQPSVSRRRQRTGRAIDGIFLLDKPVGESSNHALQTVKSLFQARKAGHTGSLDPLASGMLPVCFGQATKMSAFLLEAGKRYLVKCRFGVSTTTGDAEGEVVERLDSVVVERGKLLNTLAGFKGDISQIPPMYSALRHKGERLYKLARAGVEVEREPRPVTIYALSLVSLEGEFAEFDVECSKGTYVRTLVEDIAKSMGSLAHVVALRRTVVGPFRAEEMVSLATLRGLAEEGDLAAMDRLLQPVDRAVCDRPGLKLSPDSIFYLSRGQPVKVPEAPARGEVRLYGADSSFLGIGEVLEDGRVAPRRLFIG